MISENKTSFEIFKEWEKILSFDQKAEFKKPLWIKGGVNELGVVDFNEYAKGMDLICEEFQKNHSVLN